MPTDNTPLNDAVVTATDSEAASNTAQMQRQARMQTQQLRREADRLRTQIADPVIAERVAYLQELLTLKDINTVESPTASYLAVIELANQKFIQKHQITQ